jgi:ADP-heptose:LPS heptosyltransferase
MKPVLVVIEWHRLGDAILALPFINGALAAFDVRVICTSLTKPVFEMILPPEHVVVCEPPWEGGGLQAWKQSLRTLRTLCPAVVVSVWADVRVHMLMALSQAPRRVGFPMTEVNYYASRVPWRRRNRLLGRMIECLGPMVLGRPLLTDTLHRTNVSQSHLLAWRQIAEVVAVAWSTTTPWMNTKPFERPIPHHKPLWLIHPGARKAVRQWPAERFEEVVKTLVETGHPVVVVKPPDSPGLSIEHPLIYSVAPGSFSELASLVNCVDAVLCNDSAVSHLAAALGRKVVCIFGPMDPNIYAPYGNESHVVVRDVCPWRPCLDTCRMSSPICVEAVTGEMVYSEMVAVEHELSEIQAKELT